MEEERFLVLEDEPPMQRSLARMVRAHGVPVVAGTAREAIALLGDDTHWSGLIIDVGLPDASGFDVLAHDRTDHPATPALVLTGNAGREAIATAYSLGAAFLVKPVATEAIDHFLRGASKAGFSARVARVARAWAVRYRLSAAEEDVLRLAALGEDRRTLASLRNSSERTVGKHATNILRLTGDASLSAAVARLLREVAVGSSGSSLLPSD